MDLSCDPLKHWFFAHLSMNDLFNLFVLSRSHSMDYNKQFEIEWLIVNGNRYSLECDESTKKHLYGLIRINKLTYLCESLSAKETVLRLVATHYILNEKMNIVWTEFMKIYALLQMSLVEKHVEYICKDCDINIAKIYMYSFESHKYDIAVIYRTFLKHATLNDKVDIFNHICNIRQTIFINFEVNYLSLFIEACFNYSVQIIKYMLDTTDLNPNQRCIRNGYDWGYMLRLSINERKESWTKVAEVLCKHDRVDCDIDNGKPIKLAISTGNIKILELLLQRRIIIDDTRFNELMHIALENENVEAVRILTSNSHTKNLKLDPTILNIVQEKIEIFQSIMKLLK